MARVFEAQFSAGFCDECGDPILKGEEITKGADANLRHAECDYKADWSEYFGYIEKP